MISFVDIPCLPKTKLQRFQRQTTPKKTHYKSSFQYHNFTNLYHPIKSATWPSLPLSLPPSSKWLYASESTRMPTIPITNLHVTQADTALAAVAIASVVAVTIPVVTALLATVPQATDLLAAIVTRAIARVDTVQAALAATIEGVQFHSRTISM